MTYRTADRDPAPPAVSRGSLNRRHGRPWQAPTSPAEHNAAVTTLLRRIGLDGQGPAWQARALLAVSGIFYPITDLPGWLQSIAQVFPIYWLGLGMRSVLLPGSAVNVEIDESWRHLETVAVLGTWAIVGLAFAPIVLSGWHAESRDRAWRSTERIG